MAIIKHRRGTAAEWTASNRVLEYGEIGVEYDTYRLKIGDGNTPWSQLPYAVNEISIQDIQAALAARDASAQSAAEASSHRTLAQEAMQLAVKVSEISTSDDVVETLILNLNGLGSKTSAAIDSKIQVQVAASMNTKTHVSETAPASANEGDFWYEP